MSTPISPISVTSRPVRARLDKVKTDMSAELQRRLGRDATWNEVLERLLEAYDYAGPGPVGRYNQEGRSDQDNR